MVDRILAESINIYTHTVTSEMPTSLISPANIMDLVPWVWHVGKGWNMALFLFYSYNVISFSLSSNVLSVFLFLIN